MDKKMIDKASRLLKVLADPTRLRILLTLEESVHNVTELAERLELEQSALSHQLKILKTERLVKSKRAGRSIYYTPEDTHIYTILSQLRDHIAEEDKLKEEIPKQRKNQDLDNKADMA